MATIIITPLRAQLPSVGDIGRAVTHPAETIQKTVPQIKVDPPRPDRAPNVTVVAPGGTATTIHGDPTKPAPDVHVPGQGPIPDAVNKANDTIQDAQNKVGDLAKQGVAFPFKVAEDVLKIVGDAAKKAIGDIVAAAKAALETQIDHLWKEYRFYVYLAGGALFTILMSPALIAAWLVRRIGRRRERRMEAALDQAMKVIKAYASQAGVKLPA